MSGWPNFKQSQLPHLGLCTALDALCVTAKKGGELTTGELGCHVAECQLCIESTVTDFCPSQSGLTIVHLKLLKKQKFQFF